VVVVGTPIDLAALIHVNKPVFRARYEFAEIETPGCGPQSSGFWERCAEPEHESRRRSGAMRC